MARTISNGNGPIERKVQVTGGSTYTVSIPKAWANARDIGSGSPLHLYPFDDRLVVAQPDDEIPIRRASINADAVGNGALSRWIEAAYAAGSDEIVIESETGFDSSERRVVTDAVTRLVGIEISTERDREIVARSLLDPAEISLNGTIDQLRRISLSMHENAVRAVLGSDDESKELARHVVSRDNDADRLFALVSRQFYRALTDVREIDKLQTDRKVAFTRFRTARQLERIGDHAERIADVAIRQDRPPGTDLQARFEAIAEDARQVVRTAMDGEAERALIQLGDVVERVQSLDRELYRKNGDNAYLHGQALESVRRTGEYGGNIAEIVTLAEIV
ncbi:MAG: PhoU domain-containing protein [Halobacteriota archaeon]|uniref:PhoU domain-containing protein n=1 Tax=Natronomonas sp. TaxID=2184060 RepID=UPI003974A92C